MPGVTFTMKPKAEAELLETRNLLMNSRRAGLITSDQVRSEYLAKMESLMTSETIQQYDADAPIGVRCDGCSSTHIMPHDTKYFRCPCSPDVHRSTLHDRVVIY